MKIELIKHSGFCVGVRTAVNKVVEEIDKCDEEILIHGPLIHNPQIVAILEKRGLKQIDDSYDINNRIVAVRTHGITKQEFRKIKNTAKRIINLTCSKVAYVQGIVKKYSSDGYFTIILGDKNHAEVEGISSHATSGFFIVSNLEEIPNIPDAKKYLLVSQTTLDIEFFDQAIPLIQKKFKEVHIINTICTATGNRQGNLYNSIKEGADAIVVVGGKNSANTKRLAQIGRENKIRTFHIETEEELIPADFKDVKHTVVSAGASTPSWIINNVLEKLYEINFKNRTILFNFIKSFMEFIIRTNIFSALTTVFLTMNLMPCTLFQCDFRMPFLSAAFIFIMYSINNFLGSKESQLSKPFKYKLYTKYKYLLSGLTFIALVYYLYIASQFGILTSILYYIAFASGVLYALPVTKKIASNILKKSLRIIYGAKSVLASIGWAIVALLIPFIEKPYDYTEFLALFIIISSIIIVRNVLLDLLDYHGDKLLGIGTFPTIFGMKNTRLIFIILSILYIISVLYNILIINIFSVLYFINILYYFYLYKKIKANYYFYRLKYELLIDFNLLLYVIFSFTSNYFKMIL